MIALMTGTAVLAQTPPQPQQPRPEPKAEKGAEMTLSGEIVSVDPDAKSVTVREVSMSAPPPQPGQQPAGKTMTLNVDASTKITSKADTPATPPPAPGQAAGKTLEVDDLKAGDRVLVKYTSSGGKNVAKSIEVLKARTS
ncbi:MAG: hypothetical protein ACRD21_09450 [Vicinamibacteria bacterium]